MQGVESVTELLRIDLAQSQVVNVLESRQVGQVLQRMRRDPATPVTPDVAAEIAAREGIKAYITGDVRGLGTGFVVSARLVDAASGQVLVAGRETATGPGELIAAVDQLSRHLRERIGESLRTIRADPSLDQITTSSLEALRLYTQATRTINAGDNDRAIALYERLGFEREGVMRGEVLRDGVLVDTLMMARLFDAAPHRPAGAAA